LFSDGSRPGNLQQLRSNPRGVTCPIIPVQSTVPFAGRATDAGVGRRRRLTAICARDHGSGKLLNPGDAGEELLGKLPILISRHIRSVIEVGKPPLNKSRSLWFLP